MGSYIYYRDNGTASLGSFFCALPGTVYFLPIRWERIAKAGHTLIKSLCFFALSNVDPFANCGFLQQQAYLTSEDSPVLSDLKTLEKPIRKS